MFLPNFPLAKTIPAPPAQQQPIVQLEVLALEAEC